MTQEQQEIFDAVMEALLSHAVKIENLTPAISMPEDAYVELSGGRKISLQTVRNTILGDIPVASESVDGLMSTWDKRKLNGFVDLGSFQMSAGGENKAAELPYCSNPNILLMKYEITGRGVATIQQQVTGAKCQQLLILEGCWFTRYISFTSEERTEILQVTAWWRTMATNIDYNSETRRVRLTDYNRAHSLPNNSVDNDGFEMPVAAKNIDGLMSKEDKKIFDMNMLTARGIVGASKIDNYYGQENTGLWSIRTVNTTTSVGNKNRGFLLVCTDYADSSFQFYFGGLDPKTWQTTEESRYGALYVRKRTNFSDMWEEWKPVSGVGEYKAMLDEMLRRYKQKHFHAIIDYPTISPIEVKGGKAYCTARYAANQYEGAASTTIFKAACLCYAYDDEDDFDFVCSAVNFYTDASKSTRIRPAADGTIELAQGNSVVAVFEVPLNEKVLGRKIGFVAQDAYSNEAGDAKTTQTPVQFYIEEESIPKARPLDTYLHLHSLGGNISVHGSKFGDDWKYILKPYINGVTTSESGNISNQPLPTPDAVINIKATGYKGKDSLVVQIGQTIVEIPVEE